MAKLPAWREINDNNIEEFKTKALQGDAELQYNLGEYYSSYRLKKYKEAEKWFSLAAEQGYLPALTTLAWWYLCGSRVTKDVRKGIKFYELAIEQGDTKSMRILADHYLMDKDSGTNIQEGLRLYNLAINSGDVDALLWLGHHYLHGKYLDQDKKEAFRLYSLAAEKGHGLSRLGMCYYKGDGVEQDYNEAFRLFTKASDKKMLGECYLHGHGVERNVEKTIELWEDEDLWGSYVIYERLADLFSQGIHMEPDYKKAAHYMWEFVQYDEFEYRVKATHPEFTYKLATYYYEGKGVRKNKSKALKLFKLTVDGFHEFDNRKGCSISEEPEFVIHARKMLVKHGKKSMINILQKAAAAGDDKAKEILDEFGIELIKPKPTKVVVKKAEQPVRVVYEKPAPKPPIKISVGQKVLHKSFGEGTVCKSEGNRIVVNFKSVGDKTFLNPEAFEKEFLLILNK